MAVPKKKTSQSKRNMRRAHDALKKTNVILNKTTGEPQLSHHISLDGYYKGKQVIVEKVKSDDNVQEDSIVATTEKPEQEKIVKKIEKKETKTKVAKKSDDS